MCPIHSTTTSTYLISTIVNFNRKSRHKRHNIQFKPPRTRFLFHCMHDHCKSLNKEFGYLMILAFGMKPIWTKAGITHLLCCVDFGMRYLTQVAGGICLYCVTELNVFSIEENGRLMASKFGHYQGEF